MPAARAKMEPRVAIESTDILATVLEATWDNIARLVNFSFLKLLSFALLDEIDCLLNFEVLYF